MSLEGCKAVIERVLKSPWAWDCRDFKCKSKGDFYLVEGDCGERVVGVYSRDGRPAEEDPALLESLLSKGVEGLEVKCLSPPPRVLSVERLGSGPRGDTYEALAPPYGKLLVKVFRRLGGHRRESLVLEYFSRKPLVLVPRLVCNVYLEDSDYIVVTESVGGEPLAHVFVESARLSVNSTKAIVPPEALYIGRALAFLHRAAMECHEAWCTPRPASRVDVERWIERLRVRARILKNYASTIAGDESIVVGEASDALEELAVKSSKEWIRLLEGRPMALIHGDMHLYQVYRQSGGRLVFTDFEGEPSKEPGNPMELEPPERDLAALARSIDYARALAYMAARGVDAWEAAAQAPRILSHWLDSVVKTVLTSYREEKGPGDLGVPLLFWLVERASYEAVYELRYSTGLHPIPLEALIRLYEGRDDTAKIAVGG